MNAFTKAKEWLTRSLFARREGEKKESWTTTRAANSWNPQKRKRSPTLDLGPNSRMSLPWDVSYKIPTQVDDAPPAFLKGWGWGGIKSPAFPPAPAAQNKPSAFTDFGYPMASEELRGGEYSGESRGAWGSLFADMGRDTVIKPEEPWGSEYDKVDWGARSSISTEMGPGITIKPEEPWGSEYTEGNRGTPGSLSTNMGPDIVIKPEEPWGVEYNENPGAQDSLPADTKLGVTIKAEDSEENEGSATSLEDASGDSEYSPGSLSGSDYDDRPPALKKRRLETPKLDRNFALGSDDEYTPTGSSSSSEDSDDNLLPPARTGSRRGSGSTHSHHDVYRPSPDIVDKDLASDIVSINAHESDLSEEEIVNDKVIVRKNDKKEVTYDEHMKLSGEWTKNIKLPEGHWTPAEEDLYFRLAMRGFEPIIPSNWTIDFPTLPNTLFARPGGPEPYIHPKYETEFRAIKFLNDLLFVGNRVRDRALSGLRPEPVICHYVNNYIKWAMRDANLHNRPCLIPIHAIYAQKNSQDSRHALQSLNHRLVQLANRYREAWSLGPTVGHFSKVTMPRYQDRKFPVITGFLVCGPMVVVLTLNSDPVVNPDLNPDTSSKFISRFDFGKGGQDVWNALAVALTAVRIRKNILQLMKDNADDPMWDAEEVSVMDDPDI